MTRRCPSCGELVPREATRFCVACGKSVIADTDQQPAATRPVRDAAGPPRQHRTSFRRSRRRGWIVAILALILLAAAGVGAFALLASQRGDSARHTPPRRGAAGPPTKSASSAPSTEQSELTPITAVIQQSVSARNTVVSSTQQVGKCTMAPSTGIRLMNQAINQRRAIIDSMRSLSVAAIPGGQTMLADLRHALQQSIAADQGFIGWMQDIQNTATCPVNTSSDSSYQAGIRASARAVKAKKEFLAIWNPIASQFGQPTFPASEI